MKSLTSDLLVLLGNANGIGLRYSLLWRSRRGGSFGLVSIKSGSEEASVGALRCDRMNEGGFIASWSRP